MGPNADLMLISTDYPMDSIVGLHSGSIVVPAGTINLQVPIAHNKSYRPLFKGGWSTSTTFTDTNEMIAWTNSSIGYFLNAYTTSTDLVIIGTNYTGSLVTLHYRISLLQPSDVSSSEPFTSSVSDNFVINTDYNYPKLFTDGVKTSFGVTSINHDLGYRPQVDVWMTDEFNTNRLFYWTRRLSEGSVVTVSDSELMMNMSTYSSSPAGKAMYYRIYIDRQ